MNQNPDKFPAKGKHHEHNQQKQLHHGSAYAGELSRSGRERDENNEGCRKLNRNFPSHHCTVSHDVDLVELLIPADTHLRRAGRWWRKLCLVDQRSALTREVFRSDTAIKREISRHLTYFSGTIHPLSRLRFIWECLMIVTFATAFQMIPYDVMFLFRVGDYYPFTMFHMILLATDIVCLVDIGMTFCTGTNVRRKAVRQMVELDLRIARRKYMRLWFWIDLVSSAPDPLITRLIPPSTLDNSLLYCLHKLDFHPGCLWDFWSLMSVLKIFRFRTFLRYIRSLCQRLGLRRNVTKFTTILATVLTVFHWGTCILFLVIRLVQGTDPSLVDARSWTQKVPFWNQSSIVQYLECSYRTLYTVTHITHDFNESMTYDDMMLSLIYTICGYVLKIYLLAELFIFIRILFSSTSKYLEYRYELSNYMRHEQLPAPLQKQILKFYDIRHPKHYSRSTHIRAALGEQLFGELRMQTVGPLIRACPLFANTLTGEQLVALSLGMHFQLFMRDDIINRWDCDGDEEVRPVEAGVTSWNMIFIVSGTVAVYTSAWKEVLHLEDGEHFGELQLLFDEKEVKFPHFVAVETTEVYMLSRETFDAFLQPWPALRKDLVKLATEHRRQIEQMPRSTALDRLAKVETVRRQTKAKGAG